MLHQPPVALLAMVCRCRLKRSFESSTRPRERTAVAQSTGFEWGPEGDSQTFVMNAKLHLTLIVLMWRIGRAHNNARK